MEAISVPEKITPSKNYISFWSTDYPDYVETIERQDRLAKKIYTWLNDNNKEWSVDFDRGNFGEGSLCVFIYFKTEEQMNNFVKEWKRNE